MKSDLLDIDLKLLACFIKSGFSHDPQPYRYVIRILGVDTSPLIMKPGLPGIGHVSSVMGLGSLNMELDFPVTEISTKCESYFSRHRIWSSRCGLWTSTCGC